MASPRRTPPPPHPPPHSHPAAAAAASFPHSADTYSTVAYKGEDSQSDIYSTFVIHKSSSHDLPLPIIPGRNPPQSFGDPPPLLQSLADKFGGDVFDVTEDPNDIYSTVVIKEDDVSSVVHHSASSTEDDTGGKDEDLYATMVYKPIEEDFELSSNAFARRIAKQDDTYPVRSVVQSTTSENEEQEYAFPTIMRKPDDAYSVGARLSESEVYSRVTTSGSVNLPSVDLSTGDFNAGDTFSTVITRTGGSSTTPGADESLKKEALRSTTKKRGSVTDSEDRVDWNGKDDSQNLRRRSNSSVHGNVIFEDPSSKYELLDELGKLYLHRTRAKA